VVIADPMPPSDTIELFARYAHQNPLIDLYARTRNGRPMRFSDLITHEQLHALELYQLVYKRLGVEHQIAFTLPHTRDRILGVALSRGDRDFSDDERDLLERARPFLIQAYRNSIRYTSVVREPDQRALPLTGLLELGLTERQAEVLRLVATGASERDVAGCLGISVRTVQKHLERCYRTLDVDSRSRAAAIAWATIDRDPNGAGGYSPSMNPASSAASPGSSSAA
jgi:DNA-binding CsgD family transcriptional regulator